LPRNGSGEYSAPPGTTAVTLTTISSTSYNGWVNDVSNELSDSLPTTGVKAMEANLPLGGFKVTGMADGVADTDAATLGQVNTIAGAAGASFQPIDVLLTDISNLTDPGADRIAFWDDSDGHIVWLTAGSNLSISGTTLNASGGAGATNWGLIGGTLTDQTDLTTALAGKQSTNANITALMTDYTAASASGPATLKLFEDTDNGTNKITITPPAAIASDKTVTFQDVTGTVYVSGGTPVAVADGGTGQTSTAAAFGAFKQDATTGATGVVQMATAAAFRANTATANLALSPAEVWTSAAEVTLSDGASIPVDWSTFINAVVTLGGNRTLANGTNEKSGQSGVIRVVQDGTGSRTLAFGTDYEFAGGTAPTLSTAANANDLLFYYVISSTRVFISTAKAIA
jgi:hypothetical protein